MDLDYFSGKEKVLNRQALDHEVDFDTLSFQRYNTVEQEAATLKHLHLATVRIVDATMANANGGETMELQ